MYERYVDKHLIQANPFGIHTVPQAVGPNVCVIHAATAVDSGATFTLMGDSPAGLPLDSVYSSALNAMRWQNRTPVEVGLMAQRKGGMQRGAWALFDMMRWAVYYALHIHATDIVIGVHPHHVRFYTRCFGLQPFARPATYPLVNNNPVVPLRLALHEALAAATPPRGLTYIRDHPVDATQFQHRFRFQPDQLRGSIIERFLAHRHAPASVKKPATDACMPQPVSA